jgi:subtilisin family serine protease
MRRKNLTRTGAAAVAVLSVLATSATATSAAEPAKSFTAAGRTWTATPLTGTLVRGAKSTTGKLAKSDPALLKSTSTKLTSVVVKLDYDALASYRGDVADLPATSPAVTGKPIDPDGSAGRKYAAYTGKMEKAFTTALQRKLPQARLGRSLQTVYGGVSVRLPENEAKSLLAMPGVAAVQADTVNKPLTDASANFIGAPTVYSALHDNKTAGKGVIIGVLDTGAWPEHPSYVDPGTLPAVPPTTDGTPRPCTFGDNPLTPANDPFRCNRKLISGQPFLDTYNAVNEDGVFADSARDSGGHGTHTSTTAGGGQVAHAPLLGVDRGPIHGIAPGASIAMYKVCDVEGCFSSDSVGAVQRAILDGVKVINYSISGGADPYSDPVEMAFLDAYAAGIFVAASAGNSGPGAATAEHGGPWVTTVAASTQTRDFESTVTLAGGGASATLVGASVTTGITSPTPLVLASAAPYGDALCTTPAAAGTFTGKIVICKRGGNGRIEKGFNVKQGGAVGMLLYNGTETDLETDNHFLPAVHLAPEAGGALLAFVAAHPGATASFTAGKKSTGQSDVMASFSSRGPVGDWLKPDVTAPGVQILAGNTPVPDEVAGGAPGQLYQAIAGTSMSSPHVAGAAALVFALHPKWTPGQIKSALETTATRKVVKEDGVTPADPFDQGGGRIDLTKAGNPGLTFDETAAKYLALATDPLDRIDANVPSVNAPTMPGLVTTTRVAKNVTGHRVTYRVRTTAPKGASITVAPDVFSIPAGGSRRLSITIAATQVPDGQYFGQIDLNQVGGRLDLHLPVAFNHRQGTVKLAQACTPSTIARGSATSTCTVSAENTSLDPTRATATSIVDSKLRVTSATGATKVGSHLVTKAGDLGARKLGEPTIAPGAGPAGYLPLDQFGITPTAVGDEDILNLNVPSYDFAGESFSAVGITSNGYAVAGGGTSADVTFEPQTLPDPTPPNAVMAPYWTDLDGTGAPGVLAGSLNDGVNTWVVVEWRVNLYGTSDQKVFQEWIGVNGTEDVSFAYDPDNLPGDAPAEAGLTVGAENSAGSAGAQITGPPTTDLVVTSTPGAAGGKLSYSFKVAGDRRGVGNVTTAVTSPAVRGITVKVDKVTVN